MKTAKIKTYPNPAKDYFYLDLDLTENFVFKIILTSINGQIVYRSDKTLYNASNHTIKIPLNHLPAGTYNYKIQDLTNKEVARTGKFIKQ